MIRRRSTPDGLPYRVYERFGVRVYSIGYKKKSGVWAFRYECPIADGRQIATLRRKAILESANVQEDEIVGGFAGLIDAWFKWQEEMPLGTEEKRKDSTIKENKRESVNLRKAWGHLEPREITKAMGYDYLHACVTAKRPQKGNKEVALAHLILEYGIQKGKLDTNPLTGIRKNRPTRSKRLVTMGELSLALEVGRRFGGARQVVALALMTAYLCARRSVEVRRIKRDAIREDGLLWQDGKDDKKAPILIEWSDELRAIVNEAAKVKRGKLAGTMFVFGNMRGQQYTKGGWKSMLDDLMRECVKEAQAMKVEFRKFSLQDCRPMAVTTKLDRGDLDVLEVTGHTSDKMVKLHYDRRTHRKAKPVN